ncbi:MAG: DNA-binding protein WhiA [Ruminococcaceae bacterium]|nr:DNA-binding protein WhiA [Oscillospiraceae bacterium]
MSFSEQVKSELIALQIKPMCCRKAFLVGLLFGAAAEYNTVTARVPCELCEHAVSEIKRHFGRDAAAKPYVRGKQRGMEISFESPKCASMIRAWDAADVADPSSIFKCDGCLAAFLRGAFCATGTVSDPATGSHLEIKCTSPLRARGMQALLAGEDIAMGLVQRDKSFGVYIKNSQGVEDVLTLLGSSTMVFELLNKKIEREIRNNENRVTNCDTGNISKYVSASRKHIAAIEKLDRLGELEKLPDAIYETAMLRLRHQNVSLGELAELHMPPISKSGLNHRLQKLIDLADALPD